MEESLPGYHREVPAEEAAGLRPRLWIAVGPGFAREEAKALVLERGGALVGEAVTSLADIAAGLTGGIPSTAILDAAARQEVLRALLANRRISARLPELVRRRRAGTSFWRRLDRSIQSAELTFASRGEEEALHERLGADDGVPRAQLRQEVRALAGAYHAWCDARSLWDPPRILRAALATLEAEGWPRSSRKPERILALTAQTPESLERALWDAISREVAVEQLGPLSRPAENAAPLLSWERWHTIDDAAESLAERLAREPARIARDAVLIPDRPSVRRSLKRALRRHGIAEADARDPDRLKLDERVKWALLPLRVVARRYERGLVLSWMTRFLAEPLSELAAWAEEISARAIQDGLESYRGGKLARLHEKLSELEAAVGARRDCASLAEAHLAYLRSAVGSAVGNAAGENVERAWVLPIFEGLWNAVRLDLERLEFARAAPPLYWLERLELRLAETPAPPPREKRDGGLRVYRLQQAPLVGAERVFILGLPADWLSAASEAAPGGGFWIGGRDRERLASTGFAVRSGQQLREERTAAARAWCATAQEVLALDAAYAPDGRERESIASVLAAITGVVAPAPVEQGAQSRWLASHGPVELAAAREVRLPPALEPRLGALLPEISATTLDRYSRCPFQALAFDRWRLKDLRDPDYDLWPDVKGILLHEAVRLIVSSRAREGASSNDSEDASFALSPREALDHAWRVTGRPPTGLFRSRRAEELAKRRLVRVLEVFLEKESEYQARAKARPVALDQTQLRLEVDGKYALVGKPDRIDETADGLFVIDYKTSSSGLPNAEDLLGLGYRLQLPFYALAAQDTLGKPAAGLQFISLSRTGSRSSGLFFKRFNGKEEGKLTNVRANSKSLVPREPGEVWDELRSRVLGEAQAYAEGRFDPRPKKGEKECASCAAADICGHGRRGEAMAEEALPS